MARGGARVNSGPAPDPRAFRRERKDDIAGWRTLPAGGRTGAAPKWPLLAVGKQTAAQTRLEKLLWADLWKTPQAAAWAELGWTRDVAQYVRHKALGEMGSLDQAKEARQWSDRLGLNPSAMLRNRWRVSVDEVTPRRAARTTGKRASSRSRLEVVPDAGGQ